MRDEIRFYDSSVSYLFLAFIFIAEAIILLFILFYGPLVSLVVLAILLLFMMIAFYGLKVKVSYDVLILSYGIGIFQKTIWLASIESTHVVPNNFLTWIYSPRQEHVLLITTREGEKIVVGLGNPRQLRDVINEIISQR